MKVEQVMVDGLAVYKGVTYDLSLMWGYNPDTSLRLANGNFPQSNRVKIDLSEVDNYKTIVIGPIRFTPQEIHDDNWDYIEVKKKQALKFLKKGYTLRYNDVAITSRDQMVPLWVRWFKVVPK